MIEAIGTALTAHLPAAHGPAADAEAASLERASPAQEADFAAALRPGGEVEAARPTRGDALSGRLARQADDLAEHLKALSPGAGGVTNREAPVPGPDGAAGRAPGLDRAELGRAVSDIDRAYMFAIETTMASRGSTETTKIFNTLLKGQ